MSRGGDLPAHRAPQALSVHRQGRQDRQGRMAARHLGVLGALGGLIAASPLLGCAPKQATHGLEPLALDCSQPFAAQAERITGQPGLKAAPKDPAEPYRYYSSEDGATSYLVTEPGAPGHPAIMMQRAVRHDVKTTGCAYGDKAGYQKLAAYLDSLKTWTRKQGPTQ